MGKITESQVKEFIEAKKLVIEANTLTGTGLGQGARTSFDDMTVAMRMGNPYRSVIQSRPAPNVASVQFNVLTGDELNAAAWLSDTIQQDGGNIGAIAWTQNQQILASQFPIRNLVFNDIPTLTQTLNYDLGRIVGTIESIAISQNNDKTTTTSLRGFPSYTTGSAAYVSTGYHIIPNINYSLAATDDTKYDTIATMVATMPGAYANMPDVAFMCHPSMLLALRKLKSTGGIRLFVETGESEFMETGVRAFLFGYPVIINSTLQSANQVSQTVGDIPLIFAAWNHAMEIVDGGVEMTYMKQTKPGFNTIYVQDKITTSIVNPFAIVELTITA